MMPDCYRKQRFNYFWLGALGFTLNGGNCQHKNLHFVRKNEIRTCRAGHVSLLKKRSRSKSKHKCALAWAKIALNNEFDMKTLVCTWFY